MTEVFKTDMKKISLFELLSEISPKLLEAEEVAARTIAKKRRKRRIKHGGIVLLVFLFLLPAKSFLSKKLDPLQFFGSFTSDETTVSELSPLPDAPSVSKPTTDPEASSEPAAVVPEITEPSSLPDAPSVSKPIVDPEASSEPTTVGPESTEPAPAFILPVQGTLIQKYDPDLQIYQPGMGMYAAHDGVDVKTEAGAPVLAAADGRITRIWMDPYYGACLAIEHENNAFTIYKNLSTTLPPGIAEGVSVTQGMTVATVGTTSLEEPRGTPFLHFEMTKDALYVDPLDYLDEAPWMSTE